MTMFRMFKRRQRKAERDRQAEFRIEVKTADGFHCQDPFCRHHDRVLVYPESILEVHHFLGRKHIHVSKGITLHRISHRRCEEGFGQNFGTWLSGRQYEIQMLEKLQRTHPEFRWQAVLDEFRNRLTA